MVRPMCRKPAGAKKFIVRSPRQKSSSIFAHEYPHEDLREKIYKHETNSCQGNWWFTWFKPLVSPGSMW